MPQIFTVNSSNTLVTNLCEKAGKNMTRESSFMNQPRGSVKSPRHCMCVEPGKRQAGTYGKSPSSRPGCARGRAGDRPGDRAGDRPGDRAGKLFVVDRKLSKVDRKLSKVDRKLSKVDRKLF